MFLLIVSSVSAQKLSDESRKTVIAASTTYIDAYTSAATEVATVKSKFKLVEANAITKKEALDFYNESIGKIFGKAKTYDDAKKIVETKGFAYMEVRGLNAFGEELKRQAKLLDQ